ncbi:MAG TPA: CopD family protein [Telluria sp.]|nr:CopD family protein [Telluria sp.]
MTLAALQAAAATLFDAGLALAAGASLSALWVGRDAAHPLKRAARIGALAALAAHLALLWLQAASMAEVPLAQALPEMRTVLAETHYGIAWLAGLAAVAVALAAARHPRVVLAALAAALYAKAMSSHAAGHGDLSVAMLVHWSHLAAVTAWSGAVFAGAVAALPQALARDAALPRYANALSATATVALGVALASGAGSAWLNLNEVGLSLRNPYQALLLAKVLLVLCAAGLGGYNRWRGMPPLAHPQPEVRQAAAWRFGAVLRIEAFVLLAVLALAAVLGTTPPEGE